MKTPRNCAQTLLGVEVSKRIRALKATQKKIAARLGITQPQVSELKRGKFERSFKRPPDRPARCARL